MFSKSTAITFRHFNCLNSFWGPLEQNAGKHVATVSVPGTLTPAEMEMKSSERTAGAMCRYEALIALYSQ